MHFASFSPNHPPIMSRICTNYSIPFSVKVGNQFDQCVSEMGLLPAVLQYFSHFPKYIFSIGKTFIRKVIPPKKVVQSLFISKLTVNCNQCICVFTRLTFRIYTTQYPLLYSVSYILYLHFILTPQQLYRDNKMRFITYQYNTYLAIKHFVPQ